MVTTSCLHTPKGATPGVGGGSAQQGHRCGCFKEQTKNKWGNVKIQEGACVPGPSLWPHSSPSQVWHRGAQAWGPGLGPAIRSGGSPLSSEPQSLNSGFPSLRKVSSSPAELGAPWGKRLGQEEGMTRDSALQAPCTPHSGSTPGGLGEESPPSAPKFPEHKQSDGNQEPTHSSSIFPTTVHSAVGHFSFSCQYPCTVL